MKKSTGGKYFIGILSLAIFLMLLILAAQYFTNRNIAGLKKGNKEAAITFTLNNRLQEIVNISFILESEITRTKPVVADWSGIRDSLTMIGYNCSVLQQLNLDTTVKDLFGRLGNLIKRQMAISSDLIAATEKNDMTLHNKLRDSLVRSGLSDSTYNTAMTIGKQLETKLQATLNQNTLASRTLSALNKAFALVAVAAILILVTIIINRHLKQLQLITDLEKANTEVHKSAMIKEQFLANMSHEIRTPLNAIKGFSRLMQQTPLNPEQKQYADIMQGASRSLLQLVNDILDISKIEAGKMVIKKKQFNLRELLQNIEWIFAKTAQEKKLQFDWQLEEDLPSELKGDKERLEQVLMNLVSNALKFTFTGFVRVSVSLVEKKGDSVILEFKVTDSGIGIPEDQRDLIFERFQQIHSSQELPQQGTGLGLSIVKSLVEMMEGTIHLEAANGGGSVFLVQLPFDEIAPQPVAEISSAVSNKDGTRFSGARLLLAEDNKVNQLLLRSMLRKYGIDPDIAGNGMQVIEKTAQTTYDLILLDIQMPLMNGYDTIRNLRASANALPVVAMTAYVMPGEREKCRAAGMDDYISKPIDDEDLHFLLIKYLKHYRVQVPSGSEMNNQSSFLLNLAGGDQQIAGIILKEVDAQLAKDAIRLEEIASQQQNEGLSFFCHHLFSTVSPLGTDIATIKRIHTIQELLLNHSANEKLAEEIVRLQDDLKNLRQWISAQLSLAANTTPSNPQDE